MRGGIAAVVVVVALVGAACSTGSDDSATSATRDAPEASSPTTTAPVVATSAPTSLPPSTTTTEVPRASGVDPALVMISGLVDDDGVLPVETALSVFAALIAPLPGVTPADVSGDLPHDLAGAAARRLTAADAGLTPELAAAVSDALEPVDGQDEGVVEPAGWRRALPGGRVPRAAPSADELVATVASIVGDLEARSGHELSIAVRPRVVPTRSTGGDAVTTAIRFDGRTTACRVALPRSLFASDAASVTSTIAHEVWHCFQLDVSEAAFNSGPLWMIEGQAEFAGEAYVGGSESSWSKWDTWLLDVGTSLFRRSYDAIGVYAVAESQGVDVWRAMPAMLGLGNLTAVERLFGVAPTDAALAVASAVVRAPDVGAIWESTGPGITGANAAEVMSLPDGGVAESSATLARFSSLPVVLAVTAGDIARVSVSGGSMAAVELPESELVYLGPGGTVSYCLRPEGCVCPDGSNPGGGPELPAASPGEGAAAIAALDAGDAVVRAGLESLEDACRRDLVGVWATDVATVLAIFTAPYGSSSAGPRCDGPYRLTFTAEGTFRGEFQATCRTESLSGSGQGTFTGSYTSDETTFVITDSVSDGSMTIGSITQPLPIFDGFRVAASNPTPYVVDGDQLTITITAPDGNVFVLPLTRVG